MASIWADSVAGAIEQSLDLLAAAIRDCPGELWESSMWPVPAVPPGHQFLGPDWIPVTDPEKRVALTHRWLQRRSTPWSVAWHALEGLDYDLNGEFGPWSPPSPFAGHPHWRDLPSLPRAWQQPEMIGYVDYCGQYARNALEGMTDEIAARSLPPAHRYHGQPHASIIVGLVGHTTEHASQIRQFITAAGIVPLP